MNVSTTSGAMNSAEPTGVNRTGVLVGVAGVNDHTAQIKVTDPHRCDLRAGVRGGGGG